MKSYLEEIIFERNLNNCIYVLFPQNKSDTDVTVKGSIDKKTQLYIYILAYATPPDPKVVRWHDTNTMFADSRIFDNVRRPVTDISEDNETDSLSMTPGIELKLISI